MTDISDEERRCIFREGELGLPEPVERLLAGWLHGADCTCPHAVEPPDLARAADLLATLTARGLTVVREGCLLGRFGLTAHSHVCAVEAALTALEAVLPVGAHLTMTWPTLTEGRRYVVAALMPSEGYSSTVLGNGWADTPEAAFDALRAALLRSPQERSGE